MESTAAKPSAASSPEQLFNQFHKSTDFLEILSTFQTLCTDLGLESRGQYDGFYPELKKKLAVWRTKTLYPLLDARAALPEYDSQRACRGKRVLIVGAGPIGLRAAIEAVLLGATVDVVEKKTHFSRTNCVHIWPFVVTDLRNLGAKIFYSKFGAGGIDHICMRILQTVLLKICLLFGVRVHSGVTFIGLVEPDTDGSSGWSVSVSPASSPVSSNNYDIILAADGKPNSLPGFHSKEYRPNLALAITANFVRHSTRSEAVIPEFGELSLIARQKMFHDLAHDLDIDLENIVYFRDESHYFVMTAKKPSLLKRGVIKENQSAKQLLAKGNIDREALEKYVVDAATFSTKGALGELEFEKNHLGENDVALFDFSTMYMSENASRIVERKGKRLLLCVAGDSLVEPFWPVGTGIGRGFLGAFDAAWMMKRFSAGDNPIEIITEREAILTLLPYSSATSSPRDIAKYTIDPRTRYANLDSLEPAGDVTHLFDSDDSSVAGKVDMEQKGEHSSGGRSDGSR